MKHTYLCNTRQGFNYSPTTEGVFGLVESIKIGTITIKADMDVADPSGKSGSRKKVSGVLDYAGWNGQKTDSLSLDMRISHANQKLIYNQLLSENSDTLVEVEFSVYNRNLSESEAYKTFHSNKKKLKGFIQTGGENELECRVGNQPEDDVTSPQNYGLHIELDPHTKAQELVSQSDPKAKTVLPWGITI